MRLKMTIGLFEYWDRIRGQDRAPLRSQVEPTDLRQILSSVFLLETSDAGRVVFRLAGTRICDFFNRDLGGAALTELWAHSHDDIETIAAGVMEHAAPALLSVTGCSSAGHRACFEMILLPLRSDNGRCDKILGALAPDASPSWLEVVPLQVLTLDHSHLLRERPGADWELSDAEPMEDASCARPPSIGDTIRRVVSDLFNEGGASGLPFRHN
ncbi:PAS domain-containing protein [Rhizobium cauense]|uniref:PAS domain-containing protein n=1 Tax=Rhizobium cauense TaxID=1166683 RepID=UPI001C6E149B|nr:PAS domain-containing protein [Rhizobium cauense]MBW9114951.1 PAS domain-containing protein [Rhizobium cauense]